MTPLPIPDTRGFFRPLARELVDLLGTLGEERWHSPTVAGAWRVRDVVAHLVDTTARRLSFHRDLHPVPPPDRPLSSDRDFVGFINELNRQWIEAARRISPRVLTDLYSVLSAQLADFVEALPLDGPALFPVSWAGEERSAAWFDIGREFTEQWHHQMQIRDAVGAPALADPAWLRAFLLIALRGLPHAYRQLAAAEGTHVAIEITGPAGGVYTLVRDEHAWSLLAGSWESRATTVVMSDDTAWRLLFNALPPSRSSEAIHVSGNRDLAAPLFHARSVIV